MPAPSTTHPVLLDDGKRIQDLLLRLKRELDTYLLLKEGREAHYEDLFSAALQLVQHEMSEITNPLVGRSSDLLRDATAHLWSGGSASTAGDPFATLLWDATVLIQSAVLIELSQANVPLDLKVIADVAKAVAEVDIFTLNHDCLIEKQLEPLAIDVRDGFGHARAGYRIFNGNWKEAAGVNIFKLHGSLNWHFCRLKKFRQYAAFSSPIEKCEDEDGSRIDANPLPEFLTGTIVKEQSYGHSMIGEIFSRFRHFSTRHTRLVCSGYGWTDKGINIRLDQWLNDRAENRLVILDAKPLSEAVKARFWHRRWVPNHAAGKVVHVQKWLSGCSAAEVIGWVAAP